MDGYEEVPRPEVKVSRPRQSDSNLNPGVEIEARGRFGEFARIAIRNSDQGFLIAVHGEDHGDGSVIVAFLTGRLDVDDNSQEGSL